MSNSPVAMMNIARLPTKDQKLDFASVCESLCVAEDVASGFPLRGRLRMQSSITLGFSSDDFYLEMPKSDGAGNQSPLMHISFLTLAGIGGALPLWITEKINFDTTEEGKALHRFLDLLNRRFWELLFLKSRLGNNPRYGFCSPHQKLLFNEYCFALVGMEDPVHLLGAPGGFSVLHKTMQHCWGMRGGAGSHETLAALLTSACACKVEVCGFQPVRLPVAGQAKLVLGAHGRLSGSGGVIGAKALVLSGVELRIVLSDAGLVDQYLPFADTASRKSLNKILAVFYAQSLPPVVLLLQYLSSPKFSRLGGVQCRLGWGAMLLSRTSCSQIVRLSHRVMTRH